MYIMKIAYCLRGIHYIDTPRYQVNYKDSLENNKKFIINHLIDNKADIDYFISTYESVEQESLIEYFKPKDINLRKYSEQDERFRQQCLHHLNLIDMILNYENTHNFKYDLIINTRFDLIFLRTLREMNIDSTKTNFVFKHTSSSADDNFIIIPRNNLLDFYYAIKHILVINNPCTHTINSYLLYDTVHYMYYMTDEDEKQQTEYQYFLFNRITPGQNNILMLLDALNNYKQLNLNKDDLLIKTSFVYRDGFITE